MNKIYIFCVRKLNLNNFFPNEMVSQLLTQYQFKVNAHYIYTYIMYTYMMIRKYTYTSSTRLEEITSAV